MLELALAPSILLYSDAVTAVKLLQKRSKVEKNIKLF